MTLNDTALYSLVGKCEVANYAILSITLYCSSSELSASLCSLVGKCIVANYVVFLLDCILQV